MCSDVNKRYHVWLWAKSLCLTNWLKVTDERRDRGAHDDSIYMRCYWQVQVMTTHHWISHGWTNNNYELYNHVLKSKNGVTWNAWRTWSTTCTLWLNFNWRIFVVPSTVPATTHCADRFTCHHVTYQAWHAMSNERKEAAFCQFLTNSSSHVPANTVERWGQKTWPATVSTCHTTIKWNCHHLT